MNQSGGELDTQKPVFVVDFEVAPPPEIVSPVAEWLSWSGDMDPWLATAVREWLVGNGPFLHLVATGLYGRLNRVSDPRPAAWAIGLNEDQWEYAEHLAHVRVWHLIDRLKCLEMCYTPTESAWLEELLYEVLHGRDDVEGIRWLLRHSRPTPELDELICFLDEAADTFVRSMPLLPQFHGDERLRRVAIGSPWAWWARFV